MTLGEKISALRNQCGMSQSDLAEKMNVSRQSISKWETDTSVPELDKLILLSEVFHITLDELVKGNASLEQEDDESSVPESSVPPAQPAQVVVQESVNTRKVVGIILLCFGALILLLLTLLGDLLSGLMFSSPFILCGAICLIFKRNAGLWCAWAFLFAVNVYLRYAKGIHWSLVCLTTIYEPSMNYMRLAFAWIELICYIAIIVVTVLRFRKKPLKLTRKRLILLAAGCAAFAVTYIPVILEPLSAVAQIYFIFADWVRLILLTVILSNAVRLFHSRREQGAA